MNLRALQPKKQGPPSTDLFLEHHQAIRSVKHHQVRLLCLHWAQGASSAAERVKGTRVPPSSTPDLGDGMGQELGDKPSPTSRSETRAGASGRCSRPSRRTAAARLKPWLRAAKLPPPVPCPLSWSSLSPSLGAARGERILQAMKQQRISPHAPLQHQPAPLARCPAKPPVHCQSWQEPSWWHRDTLGQPGQQLPFKAQGVAGTAGTAQRPPPPPQQRRGRQERAAGRGLTFTPSFFLLPPLLPPGERRKEVKRARQGTKTRRPRISSMVPGGRAARPRGTGQWVLSSLQQPLLQSPGAQG